MNQRQEAPMVGQEEMFAQAERTQMPPWARYSDTSRAAAISVYRTAPTKRAQVYRELVEALPGGLTDEELQTRLRMRSNTEQPRRVELRDLGLVYDSGTVRKTSTGRMATVWKARTE